MARFWVLALCGLWLTGIVAAQTTDFWACPVNVAGQTLHVYNWTTYIAEDTISNFEALCSVTVMYDTFEEDSILIDELRAGNPNGYDVVIPINFTMETMLDENLLQPLNFDNIPNFADMNPNFVKRPFDPENRYSVPYLWGTTGIGYNRDRVGQTITSWQQVFESSARVAWIDYDRLMLGVALNLLGLNPSSSNPADLAQARDYLVANSQNVTVIADDTGQDLLAAGEVDIVIEYSGDVFQTINQFPDQNIVYAIPDEGTVTDITSLVIPVGAKNKPLAEVFIDYLLDKQVSADIANYTVYGTPNQRTVDEGLIYEDYLNDPAIYPPDAILSKLFVLESDAAIETLFSTTWQEVRALTGK